VGNPGEKGIYFEKNLDLHEEDPVGIVKGYDPLKKMARIEVKNRIDIGDTLIMISPTERYSFTLEKIIADPVLLKDPSSRDASYEHLPENGESRESGHGGHIDLWINLDHEPAPYTLIRKKRESVE
jgi:hypothetical protein